MFKKSYMALMLAGVFSTATFAETTQDKDFINDASYAIGALMSKQVQHIIESQSEVIKYDQAKVLEGFSQTLQGKSQWSDEELANKLNQLDEKLRVEEEKVQQQLAKANEEKGSAFRDAFAKEANVKATESGLLYQIEKAGEGDVVKPEDTVVVHYKGTLIDGQVFDSSYERGEPIEFPLSNLISGWVEGIQLIKKGGKIKLVVPPELGYGNRSTGNIPANSTLVFEIELLDVKAGSKK